MRLVIVLADGHGRIRVETSRAPEIRRREISRETGAAEILFCGSPLYGIAPTDLADALYRRVAGASLTAGDRKKVQELAVFEIHFRAYARQLWKGIRRACHHWTGLVACKRILLRIAERANAAPGGDRD